MENMENDLFGMESKETTTKSQIRINIYADESMNRICPYSKENWHYMCLIFEIIDNSLLKDLIEERYCKNFDKNSPYFKKNNKKLHWMELTSNDEKNICKRWFEYITNIDKSGSKFYCYILGLNESLLDDEEFDKNDKFNSIYNRFFRSAIKCSLNCFFPNYKKIIIENIYHERGGQQNHKYFKWQLIKKLNGKKFQFNTNQIEFLGKDHKENEKINIIQLCDCFMGAMVNYLDGFEYPNSQGSKCKDELLEILLPLFERIIEKPKNKNSAYKHQNRIIIRSFPREKSKKGDFERNFNQFYTYRKSKYKEDKAKLMEIPYKFISL